MNIKLQVLFGVFLVSLNLFAWQKDGVPIATGPGDQTNPRVMNIETDFVVIYRTPHEPITDELRAAKGDGKTGKILWDVLVSGDTSHGYREHQVVVDHDGMLWIVFERVYPKNPYFLTGLQKLGPNGERLLGENGMNVSPNQEMQENPQLCLDASGLGCYITWTDYRLGNPTIWVAHVTKEGQVAWTTPVCSLAENQSTPIIVKSGNGCIVFWNDERTSPPGSGIYGQRIVQDSISGRWGANGKQIIFFHSSTNSSFLNLDNNPYFNPYAIEDGKCGAVVYDIFTGWYHWQRVDSLGDLLWNPPPIIEGGIIPYQSISNGFAGVIGCVGGGRGSIYPHSDVNVVQVDSSGKSVWGLDETWVGPYDTSSYSTYPAITGDAHHGAVITWPAADYTGYHLYLTKKDSSKVVQWISPTVICNLPSEKAHPVVVKGPNMGYIVVWEDARNGNTDLYAQYVDSTGQLGINESAGRAPIANEGFLSNEPNPFSRVIKITYGIATQNLVELAMFDITGKKVKNLVNGKIKAGIHSAMWDGIDGKGKKVPAGIYFCLLHISGNGGNVISVKKIVFIGKED